MWCVYRVGQFSGKKNVIFPLFATTWIETDGIMVRERSQVQNDQHHIPPLI